MSINKINSKKGLLDYAETLGLEVPEDVRGSFAKIQAFVRQATGEEVVAKETASLVEEKPLRKTIIIQPSDTDNQPVFVGLNGKGFAIPRGIEVTVPIGVIDILSSAVKRVPVKDGTNRISGWKDAQMYPFSIVG